MLCQGNKNVRSLRYKGLVLCISEHNTCFHLECPMTDFRIHSTYEPELTTSEKNWEWPSSLIPWRIKIMTIQIGLWLKWFFRVTQWRKIGREELKFLFYKTLLADFSTTTDNSPKPPLPAPPVQEYNSNRFYPGLGMFCSSSLGLYLLLFTGGHVSQGFPQAFPREQQQEERLTPTPISVLQDRLPSPRGPNFR